MRTIPVLLALLLLSACGDDEAASPCKPGDPHACGKGLVCEPVLGGEPDCFRPVEVHGEVFDLTTGDAITGARVDAEEAGGRPVGDLAISGTDGTFALRIPSIRKDRSGAPAGQTLKLRAAARDFVPFPDGARIALPLDTSGAERAPGGAWVVSAGPTSIGLDPLPDDRLGLPSISGTVAAPAHRDGYGTLVVAQGGARVVTGRADARGGYVLFNVPPGTWTVQAYRRGLNYEPVDVTVEADDWSGVDLAISGDRAASLSGSVSIVSGNGATSIVLALESTFDEVLARGKLVPGLRAPEPGAAPDVTGTFRIEGIPDGRYVVLAAFENDGLVRDPDPDIAGTQIQHIVVSGGATSANPAFKVTSAVRMIGPGAGESVETISGAPTFRWEAYPSAKRYDLELFDTFGTLLWTTSVTATSAAYAGEAPLEPGVPYQWRVTAFGNADNPISLTEDLLGVFQLE